MKGSSSHGWRVWVALALPLLVVVLAIVRAELHLAKGDVWYFEVAGYDPRDLLRGHYLRFSLNLNRGNAGDGGLAICEPSRGDECCYCLLGQPESSPPLAVPTTCEVAAGACDGSIKKSELSGLDRFYVPESYAKDAERILQEARSRGRDHAYVAVALTRYGDAQIVDLIIDGRPISELLGVEPVDQTETPFEEDAGR